MPKWDEWVLGIGNPATKKGRKRWGKILNGTPEKRENVSTLRPEQEPLYEQLVNAGLNPGAGGAFGTSADYYRNLLSDENADISAFTAPAMRQYWQDIVPGISEQFAGGGGGQGSFSSSGFRNAQTQGAVELSERLGQIRANLRQGAAAGLANIGQLGLGNYSQNMVTEPGTPGFLSMLAPAVGTAAGAAIGGPGGAAAGNVAGNAAGNWFSNIFGGGGGSPAPMANVNPATIPAAGGTNSLGGNKVGINSSPYGTSQLKASPNIGGGSRGLSLPNFMQRP